MSQDEVDDEFTISEPTFQRLSGYYALISSKLTSLNFSKNYLIKQIKKNIGLENLMMKILHERQTYEPIPNQYFKKEKPIEQDKYLSLSNTLDDFLKEIQTLMKNDSDGFKFKGILDYHHDFSNLKLTPSEVADKIILALNSSNFKSLNCVKEFNELNIKEAAQRSTERYKNKHSLSILDGVPFFVKDSFELKGYSRQFGCTYCSDKKSDITAKCIEKLLNAGAILCGINNMVPFGINPVGYASSSGSFGITKNPYDILYYVGGSSSGNASAVASGLCPFTIGSDAQGSVRIPSSFCGISALKPTYGRCSTYPSMLANGICNTVGVLAANPIDTFIPYLFMADPDDNYMPSLIQPEVFPLRIYGNSLNSIKFGTDSNFTVHCASHVKTVYNSAIKNIKQNGCEIIECKFKNLMDSFAAMQVIISLDLSVVSENSSIPVEKMSKNDINVHTMNIIKNSFTNSELTQSLKQRTIAMKNFEDLFKSVDLLITPTVAVTCERIQPKDEVSSVLSENSITEHMRFVFLANLTGCPAMTVNCGYTDNGLPVGLQIIAPWYKEDLLVNVSCLLQSILPKLSKPKVYLEIEHVQ